MKQVYVAEEVNVLCVKAESEVPLVKGSSRRACAFCRKPVWLSPFCRQIIQKEKKILFHLICTDCMDPDSIID